MLGNFISLWVNLPGNDDAKDELNNLCSLEHADFCKCIWCPDLSFWGKLMY